MSRVLFAAYFVYVLYAIYQPPTAVSKLNILWWGYLLALYLLAEKLNIVFRERDIDMVFAFPLLFAVYLMNLVSMIIGGQEEFPIMNRLEHFAPFVLLAYVLSVFFYQYLPQSVWRDHPYYTSLLILAISSLFGVGNEIIELVFDVLGKTNYIGGQYDTSLDLLMNTLGSGLLLAVRLMRLEQEQAKK